jgi:hypothetical protein
METMGEEVFSWNDRPTNGFENWKENKLLKKLLSKELEGKLKTIC